MNKFEAFTAIENHLISDGIAKDNVNKAMAIVGKNWKEIYDDGGINPRHKEEINATGVEFDHINNIVQTITN